MHSQRFTVGVALQHHSYDFFVCFHYKDEKAKVSAKRTPFSVC